MPVVKGHKFMGKIAAQSVPYCSVNSTAAVSIGDATFATDNPPIRFEVSGAIATVYDKDDNVLGTAPTLKTTTGDTLPAEEGAFYCGGEESATLQWNGGSVATESPAITYSVSGPELIGITNETEVATITYDSAVTSFSYSGYFLNTEKVYRARGSGVVEYARDRDLDHQYRMAFRNGPFDSVVNQPATTGFNTRPFGGAGVLPFNPSHVYEGEFIQFPNAAVEWGVRFADNNYFDNEGSLTITLIEGDPVYEWTVAVSDDDGVIGEYTQNTEPTDFTYTCEIPEQVNFSYACDGECPSGTEFQCPCPETNTLYCYGFDPGNGNVFKSLFNSPISS